MLRLLFLLFALPALAQAQPSAGPALTIAQAFLADTLDPAAGNTGWALQ